MWLCLSCRAKNLKFESSSDNGCLNLVGMNGNTLSMNAPKECSKKFVATFQGKFLTRGHVLRIWVGLSYLRLGLFCLRLVFVAYGNLVWSFLLTVEIWFGLLCLRWKICLVFFTYRPPPPSKNWIWSFCLHFPHRK